VGDDGGVCAGVDGESVREASEALVSELGGGVRVARKLARKVRQIVLHMLIRRKLGIHWVAKERVTMARQKSEIGLKTVNATRGGSRWRYIVGSPGER
jgi:hypothetical protein